MKVYFDPQTADLRDALAGAEALGASLEIADLSTLAFPQAAVTIGNFDGVHRGHRLLFSRTRTLAAQLRAPAVALTFAPHPARFFNPQHAPRLIDTLEQKIADLAGAGLDALVVLPFDATLATLSARAFARDILHTRLGARHVIVGETFSFGRGREGDVALLKLLGRELGFQAHGVTALREGSEVISSSKIREAIATGDVEKANAWLGRPVTLIGEVTTGAGRGRTIGVPTANLAARNELRPATGVYAGTARVLASAPDEAPRPWPASINIGRAPTFEPHRDIKIEAHLLGYEGDLVGRTLTLSFMTHLRKERRFTSADALIAQIRRDIEDVSLRLGIDAPPARR